MPGDGPARSIPGSTANYWPLSATTILNMQWVLTPVNPAIPVFRMPHICVEGVVAEVISEDDGDHHFWVNLDGTTKDRFACEITPQNPLAPPKVGDHVRVFGIYRYDSEHRWPECHPVDHWEAM